MTTMIEKVAQAIADAQIGYERDRVSRGLASGKAAEHWEPATMRWDLMARAAIEAMMEPTVEMIDRGCVASYPFPNPRFERDMFRFSLLSEWR